MGKKSNTNESRDVTQDTSRAEDLVECYSSPCALGDVDPAYNGYLAVDELLALLNVLLEGERAGARSIREICAPAAPPEWRAAMHIVALDEGRFCTMLHRHIVRLGGVPSRSTGAFYDKFSRDARFAAQLELLNRGQGWVVRKLRTELPRITDADLLRDLTEMLAVHEQNIERCTEIAGAVDNGAN